MSEYTSLSRAGIRRLVALHADAKRGELLPLLIDDAVLGALPFERVQRLLRAYLFDPSARSIGDGDPEVEAWIDGSLLLRRLAPWNGAPIGDDIAAILVAPGLVDGEQLGGPATRWRFSARADEAVAAALATLPPAAAASAIGRLAAAPGPDEATLHLALLQAGRCLAWADPAVHAEPGMAELVEALLARLVKESPEPLLQGVVAALGPVAAAETPLGALVRERCRALIEATMAVIEQPRRPSDSFLADLRALDRQRAFADEDHYRSLPSRQLAEAAAEILGRAAPVDCQAFARLRQAVLDDRYDALLLPAFLQGLVDAAAVPQLGELIGVALAASGLAEKLLGLRIAAELPLDQAAPALLGLLDTGSPDLRAAAVRAATLLPPEQAVPALVARLDDSAPEVVALAAQGLVDLGARSELEGWSGRAGASAIDRAIALAALGTVEHGAIGVLVQLVAELAERDDHGEVAESPLVALLGRLLVTTEAGLVAALELCREVPDTLPLLVLAITSLDRAGVPVAIAIPPSLRAQLDEVLLPFVEQGGDEGAYAVQLLCRLCSGDARLVDMVGHLLEHSEGQAAGLLTALGDLRVRSDAAAELLRPFLEDEEHVGARIAAAAVAGVALPASHPLWERVRALLGLGTIASTAAFAALVHGARLASSNRPL